MSYEWQPKTPLEFAAFFVVMWCTVCFLLERSGVGNAWLKRVIVLALHRTGVITTAEAADLARTFIRDYQEP